MRLTVVQKRLEGSSVHSESRRIDDHYLLIRAPHRPVDFSAADDSFSLL